MNGIPAAGSSFSTRRLSPALRAQLLFTAPLEKHRICDLRIASRGVKNMKPIEIVAALLLMACMLSPQANAEPLRVRKLQERP